ncbi:hypothetical protein VEE19_28170 [Escherichia coli]|nr:hypothetical protein VEE19_28170 [Escherichia coli]
MNGKLQSSDVKNETPYNIPLLINENVISSGISLISLWHTYADEHYRVIWPRDKKKPLIANSWVAVYTVQGCGKILLKNGEQITLHGNCIIFLKPMGNDSNLLIVFYVQIMPDDFVMQLHRF